MPHPRAPTVSVIIVTWNGRRHIEPCLDALEGQTFRDFETIVVDNGSSDGSADLVEARYPWVRVIRGAANLGFAAGNNLGIRLTSAPYVATLNNDTLADPSWLGALVATAEIDPAIGSVASKMVFAHDPATVNSCGIALDPVGIAWDLWGGYPSDVVDQPRQVFGACGGAALYRRTMLDDVGLFDEDYFAYLEDVDLAWRARLRGWDARFTPGALVRHAHAGTLGEGSPLKRYLLARNKVWTIVKNAPDPHSWRRLPMTVTYDVGAATFGAARQRDWASVRGRLAALAALPGALEKRRLIQERRTVTAESLDAVYAPLAAPWDVPRRYHHLTGLARRLRAPEHIPTNAETTTEEVTPKPPSQNSTTARQHIRRLGLQAAGLVLGLNACSAPEARSWELQERAYDRPDSSPLRVVVIRPDHLGDVLLSRPALEFLRSALPSAEITVITGPWGAPSLQGLDITPGLFDFPGFTRALKEDPLAPYTAVRSFAHRLSDAHYDAALILRPDHWWGALAVALARIPIRVGHATPDTSPFLTHAIEGHGRAHAADAAMDAAKALLDAVGILMPRDEASPPTSNLLLGPPPTVDPSMQSGSATEPVGAASVFPPWDRITKTGGAHAVVTFSPSAVGREAAQTWLEARAIRRERLIVLHPGAGAGVKTWPAHRWASVLEGLPSDFHLVVTAGPGEQDGVHSLVKLIGRDLPVALGFDWDALAALYQNAALVVGMDSGPLHLATAVGTPTVRIYGPSDPQIYGPAGDPGWQRAIQSSLPCVPCGNLVAPPCGYLIDPPCLAAVSPGEVIQALTDLLANVPALTPTQATS